MKLVFTMLFLVTVGNAVCQDPWKNVYRESAWEERDGWQHPDELIARLNIQQGDQVADIGSHEGYMTIKLSAAVGAKGQVYAVDIDQSKLDLLKDHLKDRRISNVRLVKGDYDNPKLPAESLDGVMILDTYHEMDDHDKILQHVKAALKSGGRLVLCEPIAEVRRPLPRADQEKKHELGMNFALDDLKKAGFDVIYKKDRFVDRLKVKGDVMWIIVAVKK